MYVFNTHNSDEIMTLLLNFTVIMKLRASGSFNLSHQISGWSWFNEVTNKFTYVGNQAIETVKCKWHYTFDFETFDSKKTGGLFKITVKHTVETR